MWGALAIGFGPHISPMQDALRLQGRYLFIYISYIQDPHVIIDLPLWSPTYTLQTYSLT